MRNVHCGATTQCLEQALKDWRRREGSGHAVRFYANDEAFLDELSSFVGGALEEGDTTLVFATAAHRIGLSERLQSRGVDVRRMMSGSRYVPLDADETLASSVHEGYSAELCCLNRVDGFFSRVCAEHAALVGAES